MKFYKSILIKKEEKVAVAELYGYFGWTVAGEGEKVGLHGAENSVWLKLVRDSKTECYGELVSIETRYRRAEAESRYWEELRAEAERGKPNPAAAGILFCCFIIPGIVYLIVQSYRLGKRRELSKRAERKLVELSAEKHALIEEAKKRTERTDAPFSTPRLEK